MDQVSVFEDIAHRTGGNIYIGVVGPVRTGKSTFIKRFAETLVLPRVENENIRERARDELPQSGSGRTIMTAEPKFIPEQAVSVQFARGVEASVRLIDSVGYMIPGASGQYDESGERMVTTPWFDHEVPMSVAAEEGTKKVISDHSTIGIVVTTDGSITDIPRSDYIDAERRVVQELQIIHKPFLILLNSTHPEAKETQVLAQQLREENNDVVVLPVNCKALSEEDICTILRAVLLEFPITQIEVRLPEWMGSVTPDNEMMHLLYSHLLDQAEALECLREASSILPGLQESDLITQVTLDETDVAAGRVAYTVVCPRELYYEMVSRESGVALRSDGDLIAFLRESRLVRADYAHLQSALRDVRETGYGVVLPQEDELRLEEPEIVRQGGKYGVRLKASGSAIHMLRTNVIAEVHPQLGGEEASGEILGFLLQGFQGDPKELWESNIFGQPLSEMAREALDAKVQSMSPKVAGKLQETIQKIVNDGAGTLLCIIL